MKPSQIGNQVAANPTAKIAVTRRSRLTTLGAGFLLAALTLINGSRAFSLEAVVKDSHIKVGGNPYFRRGAEMVYLGSCGDKKTPITGENYLDVDYTISADKLSNIEKAQVYTINYKNTTKTDLFGTLSDVKKVFGFDADAAWEKVKSGELVLLELVMTSDSVWLRYTSVPLVKDWLKPQPLVERFTYESRVGVAGLCTSKASSWPPAVPPHHGKNVPPTRPVEIPPLFTGRAHK